MRVAVQPTEADYAALIERAFRGRGRRAPGSFVRTFGVLSFLSAAVVLCAAGAPFVPWYGLAMVLLYYPVKLLLERLTGNLNRRILKAVERDAQIRGRMPLLLRPTVVELSPQGILRQDDDARMEFSWSAVRDIGRDADRIYITTDHSISIVVPARQLDAPEAFEAFYETARRYREQARTP